MLNTLLLIGSYQSLIFSILLLAGGTRKGNCRLILGSFFMLLFLHHFTRFLLEVSLEHWYLYAEFITIPVALLLFPVFNMYVRCIVDKKRGLKRTLIHFIPSFLFFIIYAFEYGTMPLSDKFIYFKMNYWEILTIGLKSYKAALLASIALFAVIPFQALYYSTDALKQIFKHRKAIKDQFASIENKKLTWILVTMGLFCGAAIFGIGAIFWSGHFSDEVYFLIAVPVFTAIGIFGVYQNEIYINRTMIQINEPLAVEIAKGPDGNEINLKIEETEACEPQKAISASVIQEYFERSKPYLDPDLSINDVARALNTNKTYLSRMFNTLFGDNFYTFVNRYRINETKQKLRDVSSQSFSIEGIATLCGFRSQSAFYAAFKAFEGVTPSVYRRGYS